MTAFATFMSGVDTVMSSSPWLFCAASVALVESYSPTTPVAWFMESREPNLPHLYSQHIVVITDDGSRGLNALVAWSDISKALVFYTKTRVAQFEVSTGVDRSNINPNPFYRSAGGPFRYRAKVNQELPRTK